MRYSKIILDVIDGNFTSFDQRFSNRADGIGILKEASRNRVLYAFCDKLMKSRSGAMHPFLEENIRKILVNGEQWQSKLRNTLTFVNSFFPQHDIPFLVVKTYRSIPYVTFDVDVLVHPSDFGFVSSKLKEIGELGKHPGKQTKKQVNFFASNQLTVDLHENFSWQGSTYLDDSFAWLNTRKQEIAGVAVPIPSAEVEYLLEAAHLLFERRYITLLDYVYLRRMSQKPLDTQAILKQVQCHGWDNAFTSLMATVNEINYFFEGNELNPAFARNGELSIKEFDMPYFLSPLAVVKVFYEKYRKQEYFPKFDFLYYFFTLTRYHISGKRRYPYYIEWFSPERIKL